MCKWQTAERYTFIVECKRPEFARWAKNNIRVDSHVGMACLCVTLQKDKYLFALPDRWSRYFGQHHLHSIVEQTAEGGRRPIWSGGCYAQ